MIRLIAILSLLSLTTGCIFSVGAGSSSSSNCTITVNDDNSYNIRGTCPKNLRVNVAGEPKEIEIETETEIDIESE
jgi:hypothetical protein